MPISPRGSLWNRWDLHFHTPSSYDYKSKATTNEQLIARLKAEGVGAVAVTDHHVIDIARIKELQRLAADDILVLPGIELRCELGGKDGVHFIGIFPEDSDLDELWKELSVRLGITEAKVRAIGNDKVYCDFKQSAELIRELGGIVTMHGHGKSSSFEGIGNLPEFKAKVKEDLLTGFVDIVEVGNPDRVEDYTSIVFPEIGLVRPIVICSDNHDVASYSCKGKCWLRCDRSFRGLRMALREPLSRWFIGETPPDHQRLAGAGDRTINSIAFARRGSAKEKWFDGAIPLNPGLIAVIGNKGSGKSALADTLGLLGGSPNGESFSFLTAERFKHARNGHAEHYDATIQWASGEQSTMRLSEQVATGAPERIKYLPQAHVEQICNEISASGGAFERELKAVIFSHVGQADRTGAKSLDELIDQRSSEKLRRIDTLLAELRELSRSRTSIESSLHPSEVSAVNNKLGARQRELAEHEKVRPPEPAPPKAEEAADPVAVENLSAAEAKLAETLTQVTALQTELAGCKRRLEAGKVLAERLQNLRKDFDSKIAQILAEAETLGVDLKDAVRISINGEALDRMLKEAEGNEKQIRSKLDPENPDGLASLVKQCQAEVAACRQRLDQPARDFREAQERFAKWKSAHEKIVGSPEEADTVRGLEAWIATIPERRESVKSIAGQQSEISRQILTVKLELAQILADLYGPVQSFVTDHKLAKGKLQLEFRVDLVAQGFESAFLSKIARNRKGSFMGIDEGTSLCSSEVERTKWREPASVREFLENIDLALHFDNRPGGSETHLKDQLSSGSTAEDIYDCLYGLDYVQPRYILRWEGKDIHTLSPGERGTLLLTFYLLVDQSDLPLVIDQPEGNLDNNTVAKGLVDCIRAARAKRQVIIVTHNPNLAVVCDADQVIHAHLDMNDSNRVTYTTGSLESPAMNGMITDVLEGSLQAFGIRGDKYRVGGQTA